MAEEHATRETRRIGVALKTARLTPPKTLESFDFTFRPSLDRSGILALAQLDFVARAEVVHFLGPPGTGKSHLATALGVAAGKAGRRVWRRLRLVGFSGGLRVVTEWATRRRRAETAQAFGPGNVPPPARSR